MIQKHAFMNEGGFVLHKITVPGNVGHCSAWYTKNGQIHDAERIDRLGRATPVKPAGPTWKYLAKLGPRYAE